MPDNHTNRTCTCHQKGKQCTRFHPIFKTSPFFAGMPSPGENSPGCRPTKRKPAPMLQVARLIKISWAGLKLGVHFGKDNASEGRPKPTLCNKTWMYQNPSINRETSTSSRNMVPTIQGHGIAHAALQAASSLSNGL